MAASVQCKKTNFDGYVAVSATVSHDGYILKDTSAAGAPTCAGSADGLTLTLPYGEGLGNIRITQDIT